VIVVICTWGLLHRENQGFRRQRSGLDPLIETEETQRERSSRCGVEGEYWRMSYKIDRFSHNPVIPRERWDDLLIECRWADDLCAPIREKDEFRFPSLETRVYRIICERFERSNLQTL
jgi:hypothetical protein